VDFGDVRPFVFALCCLSGCYEDHPDPNIDGGDDNIAEAFHDSGAAVYIGSTEKSNWDPDTEAGTTFFETWEANKTIGWAFTSTKRTMSAEAAGSQDWVRYWRAEYNLYGDPKFGAVASAGSGSPSPVSEEVLEEPPPPSIDVVVPDYEVNTVEGVDYVEIPDGMMLLQEGEPAVPYYATLVHVPEGLRIQDVVLTDRSGLVTDTGLNLPLTDLGPKCSVSGSRLSSSEGEDWYPDQEYGWRVVENLDGSSTLVIAMYPFYYNPLTTDVRFYKNYSFDIDYTVSPVTITELTTDKDEYQQDDTVMADIGINNSAEPQDVIVSAVVNAYGSGEIVDGLLLSTLKNFAGPASFSPQWDSGGFEPGYYSVEVTLQDTAGNVLDRRTQMFRLGISSGEVTSFTATPEYFQMGDDIEINMTFSNTGRVSITGSAVIRAFSPTGDVVEEFAHEITDLMPAESISFNDIWAASEGFYNIVGYVSYDSKATDPATVTVQTDSDLDGFGDAVEGYLGTDSLDACPDDPTDDAWPLDVNMDTFVTVVGDVLPYRGRIGATPGSAEWWQRLDLNADNYITVAGDAVLYRGMIGKTCT
jgi:hypothetical protein